MTIPFLRMSNWNRTQPMVRWHHLKPKQSLGPYEEFVAIGSVTSDSVAREENPAYQPAEPPQYEYVEGVTSSDVAMEEDPAYQSVDTAVSQQTEEPEYL